MKAVEKLYDFGWEMGWLKAYLVTGTLAMTYALVLMFSSGHGLASFLLLLVAVNFYAGWAAIRFINRPDRELVLPWVDLVTEEGPVLDAGCGSGRSTVALGKALGRRPVVALDRFDAEYIRKGGKELLERNLAVAGMLENVEIVGGDVMAMGFEEGRFAAAVCVNVIDHVGKHQLTALKELYRVLKRGGRLLLIVYVPNYFSLALFNVLSLIALTSKAKWESTLTAVGFGKLSAGELNGAAFFLLQKP